MKNRIKAALVHSALIATTATAAVAVGSQVPELIAQVRGNVRNGDFALHVANQPHRLTLYGTTTCPYCVSAREYLKRAGIGFNDQIIDTSPESQRLFAKLNPGGVPVLVSRSGLILGFDPDGYDELAKASANNNPPSAPR